MGKKKKKDKDKDKDRDDHNNNGGGAKVKLFPMEKGPTPSKLEPKDVTGLIKVGKGCKFKTEDEVIKFYKYKMGEKLGEGGFGKVYIAYDTTKKDRKCACKVMALGNNIKSSLMEDMKNELFIMQKVQHLYVVKIWQHFVTLSANGNKLYLFMELADGGDFGKFINKNGPLTESDSKLYMAQFVCGINHMHSLGIAHRDIKPGNVLLQKNSSSISGDYLLLVTDFGLSRIVHHTEQGQIELNRTVCGTPLFMAPELLLRKPYNSFGVDIWALGITLYIMLTCDIPFDFRDRPQAVRDMCNKKWDWDVDRMKSKPSTELNSLMKSMLEPEQNKRIQMSGLIKHSWFAKSFQKAQAEANKKKIVLKKS